jgi:hypothetical protein
MSVTVAAIQMNSLDNLQNNLKQAEVVINSRLQMQVQNLQYYPKTLQFFAAGMQIHTAQQMSTYSNMVSRAIAKT